MIAQPTATHLNALAVFEGPKRVVWRRRDPESWVPLRLWPSPHEAEEISGRLACGNPLLVVLDEPCAVIPLLAEEVAAAPAAVVALVDDPTREPAYLVVPALNWLPTDLRERGLLFLQKSMQRAAQIPRPLLPAMSLEAPDTSMPNLRFAHRLRSGVRLDHDIAALLQHIFGDTCLCTTARARARP